MSYSPKTLTRPYVILREFAAIMDELVPDWPRPHTEAARADVAPAWLSALSGIELSADIVWGPDGGDELYTQVLAEPQRYRQVASSGSGDGWLLDLHSGQVGFFDHDRLEADQALVMLGIDLIGLVRVADAWAQFEARSEPDLCGVDLDEESCLDLSEDFCAAVAALNTGLPRLWPYLDPGVNNDD